MRLFVVPEEEKAHLRLRRQAVSVKLLSVARDKRPEARNRQRCCGETRTLLGARNMVEINSTVDIGVLLDLVVWFGLLVLLVVLLLDFGFWMDIRL